MVLIYVGMQYVLQQKPGIPGPIVRMLQRLYTGMEARVCGARGVTEPFA